MRQPGTAERSADAHRTRGLGPGGKNFHSPYIEAAVDCELAGIVGTGAGDRTGAAREQMRTANGAGVMLTVFHNRRWDADIRTLQKSSLNDTSATSGDLTPGWTRTTPPHRSERRRAGCFVTLGATWSTRPFDSSGRRRACTRTSTGLTKTAYRPSPVSLSRLPITVAFVLNGPIR